MLLRLRFVGSVVLFAGLCAGMPAAVRGMYMRPQLDDVPIDRLVANLTELAEKNPKDAQVRFNLARVHAMAYALKTDKAQVQKGREGNGAWFGFEPANVPFVVKPTDDAALRKAAAAQLELALADYARVIALDPKHLAARLGYAWCLEQAGQKEDAIREYRKTIELGWEAEKDSHGSGPGHHWIVVEAGGYLKPHLDAEKDKAELARLAERTEFFNKKPRAVTPIAVPLKDGLAAADLEDHAARVRFDADGSGERKQWSWIKPSAAWLVYDQNGAGKPDSALQLFGGVTFWCFWENGYQALSALDNNHDGQLTGAELAHLSLWNDANGNGIADPGEVRPLADHGIISLSCDYKIDPAHPDRIAWSKAGVTFNDGSTRPTYDIVLHGK